jgi:(Z)-2-((N-methylformamido)methylene)-5-hydroxybutyrolactone dehydrogenase
MTLSYEQDKLYIGGTWTVPLDGDQVQSIDPSNGQPWARVAFAGPRDVETAVEAANAALKGPWSKWSPARRSELLRSIGAMIEANIERLAQLETRDNGMLLSDARNNVRSLAQYWYYFAGMADKLEGRNIPVDDGYFAYTSRVPVGVVAAILPWNAPLQMVTWKLAPALAAGCTVIIKSAEQTPVTAYEFARLLGGIDVPPGVINIICGTGADVGRKLVAHPRINKISFTGEHRTAQDIMRGGAVNLKRLTFECGGKAPHIIFDDADLAQAINAATHSSFALCGQSCALGSRLLVQRSIYDKVAAELSARARRIRVGQPAEPGMQMGPQAHQQQLDKTLQYIDIGQAEGAQLLAGGTRLSSPDLRNGYFVAPTVFGNVNSGMRIAREEIFGPVVSIMPFDSEDEVIQTANDTEYGLVAGIWSTNIGRAHRVASQIQAGTVWINTYRFLRWSIPYGGFKMSGMGRENGMEALDPYLQTRATIVNLTGQYPDAYPISSD